MMVACAKEVLATMRKEVIRYDRVFVFLIHVISVPIFFRVARSNPCSLVVSCRLLGGAIISNKIHAISYRCDQIEEITSFFVYYLSNNV